MGLVAAYIHYCSAINTMSCVYIIRLTNWAVSQHLQYPIGLLWASTNVQYRGFWDCVNADSVVRRLHLLTVECNEGTEA